MTNVTHTTCHSVDIYQISDLMNWAIDLNQKFMPFCALCVPLFVSAVIIPLLYLLFVSIVTVFVYCVINIHTSSRPLSFSQCGIFSICHAMEHEYSIAFINISFLTNQTRIDWHREQHWNDDLVRYTFSYTDTKTVTKMVYFINYRKKLPILTLVKPPIT